MGQIMRRLESGEQWRAADVALRAAGLGLLALFVGVSLFLHHQARNGPRHEPYVRDYVIACVAFLSWSTGCALLTYGPRLFARVQLPERQVRYPALPDRTNPEGKIHE